jgi:hypothetical protein
MSPTNAFIWTGADGLCGACMQVMTLCHWPSSLAHSRGAGGFGVGSCAPARGDPITTSGVSLVCAAVRGALYSLHGAVFDATLYAIVTVLVLAMRLLISA